MLWNLAELNMAKIIYVPDGPEIKDFNDALGSVKGPSRSAFGFAETWPPPAGKP